MIKLKELLQNRFLSNCNEDFLKELAYKGNIGLVEMMEFYDKATDEEKIQMEDALTRQDIDAVLALLKKVTGIELVRDS